MDEYRAPKQVFDRQSHSRLTLPSKHAQSAIHATHAMCGMRRDADAAAT
jgi:hypothetical protein